MRSIIIIILSVFYGLYGVMAQEVKFTATATPGVLRVGEQFQLVYELNAHWIKSLKKMPLSSDWLELGDQLCPVFDEYFKKYDRP